MGFFYLDEVDLSLIDEDRFWELEPPKKLGPWNDKEKWRVENRIPHYDDEGNIYAYSAPPGGPILCEHLTPETSSGYSPNGSETYWEDCKWCDARLRRLIDKVIDK